MEKLLTSKEVAGVLQVSLQTVRRYMAAGLIKFIRMSRSPRGPVRFRQAEVEKILTTPHRKRKGVKVPG